MKRRYLPLALSLILGTSTAFASPTLPGKLPVFDDQRFPSLQDKSQEFVEYLYRIVERENMRILSQRETLAEFEGQISQGQTLSDNNVRALERLARLYGITDSETPDKTLENLTSRVMPIPPSLILAHALSEGRWNALDKEASLNLFHVPCLPNECPETASENVASKSYRNIHTVIEDYIHNLNTNSLFVGFRDERLSDYEGGHVLNGENYLEYWKPLASTSEVYLRMGEVLEKYDLVKYDSWH